MSQSREQLQSSISEGDNLSTGQLVPCPPLSCPLWKSGRKKDAVDSKLEEILFGVQHIVGDSATRGRRHSTEDRDRGSTKCSLGGDEGTHDAYFYVLIVCHDERYFAPSEFCARCVDHPFKPILDPVCNRTKWEKVHGCGGGGVCTSRPSVSTFCLILMKSLQSSDHFVVQN
ncbi:uncharacterized protein ACO6RY_01981 [Pungitius sinensis]